MKWTFEGVHNEIPNPPPFRVEVEADNEAEARHLAMVARWGSRAPNIMPSPMTGKYVGAGLTLISGGNRLPEGKQVETFSRL